MCLVRRGNASSECVTYYNGAVSGFHLTNRWCDEEAQSGMASFRHNDREMNQLFLCCESYILIYSFFPYFILVYVPYLLPLSSFLYILLCYLVLHFTKCHSLSGDRIECGLRIGY